MLYLQNTKCYKVRRRKKRSKTQYNEIDKLWKSLNVGLSLSRKKICFNDNPSKMMKNAFNFILKYIFPFSRYLNFCLDFLVMQKKQLDQKHKVNVEIYDVKAWLTKNYNTHIAQYLTNKRQPDNEIWSVNKI